MSKEAMQMALEALENAGEAVYARGGIAAVGSLNIAAQALRQALKTEPFEYWNAVEGWVKIDEMREHFDSVGCGTIYKSAGDGRSPLYTAPPKAAEWVGLTDEEVMVAAWKAGFDIHEDYDNDDDPEAVHWWSADGEVCDDSLLKLRDLIEAKLKEKNNG
jgi:hypothetical protein